MLSLCLLCSLLFCSGVNVSAAEISIDSDDGWHEYKTIDSMMLFWGSDDNLNAGGTTSWTNLSLPVTKTLWLQAWYTNVWAEVDVQGTLGESWSVPPGETFEFLMYFMLEYSTSSQGYVPLDPSLYSCNLVTSAGVLSPSVKATFINDKSAGWIQYTYTNNTTEPVSVTTVRFGHFQSNDSAAGSLLEGRVNNVRVTLDRFQYRLRNAEQMAADQTADAIEKQTEEHRNLFQQLGDRISGFFENLTGAIGGFFTQLGDRISGFFDNLLTGILDGLKSLFIPDSSYFTEYFDQWDEWMTEHFGALYYPIDLILEILDSLWNLDVPENPTITFPAIQIGDTVLLEAQQYTFLGDDTLPALKMLYESYRVIVIVIFVFALSNLAWRKLNSIMGGGQ